MPVPTDVRQSAAPAGGRAERVREPPEVPLDDSAAECAFRVLAITRHTTGGMGLTELRYSLYRALHLVGLDSYPLTQDYLPADGVGPAAVRHGSSPVRGTVPNQIPSGAPRTPFLRIGQPSPWCMPPGTSPTTVGQVLAADLVLTQQLDSILTHGIS